MKNNKFDIVLKKDRGNYMPIDISLLELKSDYSNDLMALDLFTINYTKNELLELIKKANIVADDYLDGELRIAKLDSEKHRYVSDYPILTSDYLNGFNLEKFLEENIKDKNLMNTIRNKYKDYLEEDYKLKSLNSELKEAPIVDFSKVGELNKLNEEVYQALKVFDEANNKLNYHKITQIILDIDYIQSRKLCSYIIENLYERKEKKELLREKIA